jgi:hypothetical protein
LTEKPKRIFIQLLKKKVGTRRYSNTSKKRDNRGNRSKKKLKNKNSAIKKIVPGNPKKTKQLINAIKNNLGQRKLIPLISVISLVLNLRFIASTNKNELVERSAWLINIQKLASINADWPLITHIVSQCISTTVE